MPDDREDKTEQPTEHRRRESREKGQVAHSADLSAALLLLGGMLVLFFVGGGLIQGLHEMVHRYLGPDERWLRASAETIHAQLVAELERVARFLLPLLLVMTVLAVAVGATQVGFLISSHPLMPSLGRISPLKGFARIFSRRGLVKLAVSLAKVTVIGAVATAVLFDELSTLVCLSELSFGSILEYGAEAVFSLGLKLAGVLIVLGLLDYGFQRWQHEQELKMTKQELREEMRRMEGDPLIRERRRQMARRVAMARIAQKVPKADVVVTNPTELAVALQYDADIMAAPTVVAKGAGLLARRIRELAAAHGVPIVEKRTLAQALYKDVEVGQQVPPKFYRAVAEVLAYVYELNRKTFRPRVAT